MQQFSRYKKDKIAHYHKDSWMIAINTINKFSITYKELYKIIDNSAIFNFKELKDWTILKKCISCDSFKKLNEDNYYKRNGTSYYYSSCKICMKQLARTYRIMNASKIYKTRCNYDKEYWQINKNKIKNTKSRYYNINRIKILYEKKMKYSSSKFNFIRKLLFKLRK